MASESLDNVQLTLAITKEQAKATSKIQRIPIFPEINKHGSPPEGFGSLDHDC